MFVAGNGVAVDVVSPASPPVPASSLANTGIASILSINIETKIEILFWLSIYDGRDTMI